MGGKRNGEFRSPQGWPDEIAEVRVTGWLFGDLKLSAAALSYPSPVFGGVETSEARSLGGAKRRVG
jgi:hypothetical protein